MSQLGGGYYSPIQGNLPFAPGGNPVLGAAQLGAGLGLPEGAVQGLNTLAGQYGQSYQAALQQNQAMYNNILGGYQQLMGNQQAAQQPIIQGYANLKTEVLGDIKGIDASEKQAIQDAYASQSGAAQQSLINRGLGNATISDSVQRGLGLDQQKAQIALQNQMAQLTAGYASNLGQAGLNYQNQANMQNTALGQSQLNFMNSVQAGYPDPNAYNALFGQAGQMNQAAQNQALQRQLLAQRQNPFGGGGGAGGGPGGITYGPHANLNALGGGFGPQNYGGGGGGGGGSPYMSGYPNTLMQQMPPLQAPQTINAGSYSPDAWAGADPNAPMDALMNDPSLYAQDPTAVDPTMQGTGSDWTSGFGLGGDMSGGGAMGGFDFGGGGDFSAGDFSGYA
jgi:hypothetical protein